MTGQTGDGKSVFVSDAQVEPVEVALVPGYQFHRLWGSDVPPALPSDGSPPDQTRYFPPPGGYRFGFFTVGPDSIALPEDLDVPAALDDLERRLPGIGEVMEPDHPGMHTTDTVDVDFVVSGEVWLELDDGQEVHLRAGDTVIQNGTRHAWHNRTGEPCVVFVGLLGAPRRPR
ncbi:MAG: cupin domain-containing protein [Acidimicrobiales bacterium]